MAGMIQPTATDLRHLGVLGQECPQISRDLEGQGNRLRRRGLCALRPPRPTLRRAPFWGTKLRTSLRRALNGAIETAVLASDIGGVSDMKCRSKGPSMPL